MRKKLEVVYVDNVQTDIEVKATIIKPEELIKEKYNRAKKKQEDRKKTKDYVDR